MTDYAVLLPPSLPLRRLQLLFPQSNSEGLPPSFVRLSKTATAPRILRSKWNGWNGRAMWLASDKAIGRGGQDRRTVHDTKWADAHGGGRAWLGCLGILVAHYCTAVPCWYLGAGKFLRRDGRGSFVRSASAAPPPLCSPEIKANPKRRTPRL